MSYDPSDDYDPDVRKHTVRVTVQMDIEVEAPSGSDDSYLAECVTDKLEESYDCNDVTVMEIELKEVD